MKIVLANGCFDGLHIGHLIHLKAAREMGNKLVVALTDDKSVRMEKGNGRPFFCEEEREEFLEDQRFVDQVIIVPNLRKALELINPDIFVKGPDYKMESIDKKTKEYCFDHYIEIRFTEGPKFSSSALFSQIYK